MELPSHLVTNFLFHSVLFDTEAWTFAATIGPVAMSQCHVQQAENPLQAHHMLYKMGAVYGIDKGKMCKCR